MLANIIIIAKCKRLLILEVSYYILNSECESVVPTCILQALINSLFIIMIIIIRARNSHPLNSTGFNSRMVRQTPIIQSSRNGMQAYKHI